METRILRVDKSQALGKFEDSSLERWQIVPGQHNSMLEEAASHLRQSDIPVAFPTETVYGLGADATRTGPVKGIYKAKGRPSDNPLIVHVCDLKMLRSLLRQAPAVNGNGNGNGPVSPETDPIPEIYKSIISRFWPGPITMLFRKPAPDEKSSRQLAPEVTAGLKTFGVRMPDSALALSLIKIADTPLAAPSANASTKPSPTAAQHVKDDLDGRIELILDGGSCQVGVESTVVDGLCSPPVILRPGGISMEELKTCPGWEQVEAGYKDKSEEGKAAPRAPGMKYKHYSPKAKVILYEHSAGIVDQPPLSDLEKVAHGGSESDAAPMPNGNSAQKRIIGIIRTRRWRKLPLSDTTSLNGHGQNGNADHQIIEGKVPEVSATALDIDLGQDTRSIAHGLFSALRELDQQGAQVIFVEGVEDSEDIAAAVMNRLRKAASEIKA
ncbi:translation initiation protein sua5 [Zalerion maritima]|uniref:Threonylcarbamoyl-AMP synthase n=1 Tax=Zalerion maritima TaxID=339359 RepID=A0AAD5WS06_9PEZI|nr:translation initiation protein sua5 [Zalerion maritima]